MKKVHPLVIVALVIIMTFAYAYWSETHEGAWITDSEYLYDRAIDYIVEEKTEKEKYDYRYNEASDFQVFTDYHGFGIKEINNYRYAYMWVLEESYYVKGDTLYSGSGRSGLYKFKFNQLDQVIDSEQPKDGGYYTKSVKDMFPKEIVDEILKFNSLDRSALDQKVKEHYSYLDNNRIYHEIGDEIFEDTESNKENSYDKNVVVNMTDAPLNEVPVTNETTDTYDYKQFTPNELDKDVFVVDFDNYKPKSNETKITKEEASKIAQKGFDESKKRIAGEGADDFLSEKITLEEVSANNYFTRTYLEGDMIYKDLKRNAYVVKRENEMGNGIKVYVDATTGLIIGGQAFGD